MSDSENIPGPVISPGWYIDPQNPDQVRWWDGSVWTQQVGPSPAAAGPHRTSPLAWIIDSVVLAVFAVFTSAVVTISQGLNGDATESTGALGVLVLVALAIIWTSFFLARRYLWRTSLVQVALVAALVALGAGYSAFQSLTATTPSDALSAMYTATKIHVSFGSVQLRDDGAGNASYSSPTSHSCSKQEITTPNMLYERVTCPGNAGTWIAYPHIRPSKQSLASLEATAQRTGGILGTWLSGKSKCSGFAYSCVPTYSRGRLVRLDRTWSLDNSCTYRYSYVVAPIVVPNTTAPSASPTSTYLFAPVVLSGYTLQDVVTAADADVHSC